MKIGIIGTRGIPNNYGGFEQFAQYLSVGLTEKGHEVFVYNSHNHLYKEDKWKGVNIIHKYDPEFKIGTAGQFIYDLNCILDSRKRKFDIILNLGYTSSSIWGKFFPKKTVLITNMDGLEWKRTKFSKRVQKFLLYAEKLATIHSDVLIADSIGIQKYITDKYNKQSHYIAYGADLFESPDESILKEYNLSPFQYNMLIARIEPENNIELILDGIHASSKKDIFLVIGNYKNNFGQYLFEKYKSNEHIKFMGPIYNINVINNLRYYSNLYFHGHSVGGTNPSLLEAMASSGLIVAHDNDFNKSILNEDAFYFTTPDDIKKTVESNPVKNQYSGFIKNNCKKIKLIYSWKNIIDQYEQVMLNSL
ncbi:MAG: DUF1972 domain-containing protein [Bacteroidota bacterium]